MLQDIYNKLFYFETPEGKKYIKNMEFVITSECNLKCSYCYLKSITDLYPVGIRDRNGIISNLRKLLESFLVNRIYVDRLSIFSGEIWHEDFGVEVLEIIYEYCCKDKIFDRIIIPSNHTFVFINPDRIQDIIDRFRSLNISFIFSCSIDGLYIDKHYRQYKGNDIGRAEKDYDTLFSFLRRNRFGIHPMVSADSTKYWVENYNWLMKMSIKFKIGLDLMMFEVRNGNWNKENIGYLETFLKHVFEVRLRDIYHGDKLLFIRDNLKWHRDKTNNLILGYNNLELIHRDGFPCSLQNSIFIRIGDLSFVPCHRLSYDNYIYGKLNICDNRSIQIEDRNVDLAIKLLSLKKEHGLYGCAKCDHNYFCVGPCLGANYEYCGDPCFTIDDQTCNMQKARHITLAKLYVDIGILDLIKNDHIQSGNRKNELMTYNQIVKILGLELYNI